MTDLQKELWDIFSKLKVPYVAELSFRFTKEGAEILEGWISQSLVKRDHDGLIQKLFASDHRNLIQRIFASNDVVLLRPGAEHPEHPRQVHPDNFEAAHEFSSIFDKRNLKIKTTMEYDNGFKAANRVSFGSPTSTKDIELVMGVMAGGRVRKPLSDIPLQFKYVFGERSEKRGLRYVGSEKVDRKLTTLFETEGNNEIRLTTLRENNWLEEDALLITSFPNIFSIEAYQKGFRYVNIAGPTGVGTKAVGVLMSDKKSLQRINKRVKNALGFQALLRVSDIEHDNHKSVPQKVEFIDACPIELDEERIQQWMERNGGLMESLGRGAGYSRDDVVK